MRISSTVTTTDKFWCTDCKRKLPKGTLVIYRLTNNGNGGKLHIHECYCKDCPGAWDLNAEMEYMKNRRMEERI